MGKKLYRSRQHSQICGVAGGIADYLGIDPTLVRLFFGLIFLVYGVGIGVYFVLAIIIPLEPKTSKKRKKKTIKFESSEKNYDQHKANQDDEWSDF